MGFRQAVTAQGLLRGAEMVPGPDLRADQAQPQIPQNAKALAFPLDDQPGEAAAEQTNDYPNDELIE